MGTSAPSMASGVTTSVTHGIASALATSPTRDTWPNSSNVSGASATVMTHCSRNIAPTLATACAALPPKGANLPWGGPAEDWSLKSALAPVLPARVAPESVANSTPTATKLNQKPGCNNAHGSTATTTAQASNQTCGQGQRAPVKRSSETVASMVQVRCAGTPQPENTA